MSVRPRTRATAAHSLDLLPGRRTMPEENEGDEQQQEEAAEEIELPEAAPTDYRGNAWLLVFMIGVVIVAWLVGQLI